jgi:TonB family protein
MAKSRSPKIVKPRPPPAKTNPASRATFAEKLPRTLRRMNAAAVSLRAQTFEFARGWLFRENAANDNAAGAALLRRLASDPVRYAALGSALVLNLVLLWVFAANLKPATPAAGERDIEARIFAAAPVIKITPLDLHVDRPEPSIIPVPQVDIPAPAPTAISGVAMSQMMAPRPDPQHINVAPDLPDMFKSIGTGAVIILKVLVRIDGSIGDAQVVKSSGDAALDQVAIDHVKENWRYIPAQISGTPIQDWTTIMVPFRA